MKAELDTPALLIDYDKMLKNITAMQRITDEAGVNLRPHIKTHKRPQIARLQQWIRGQSPQEGKCRKALTIC